MGDRAAKQTKQVKQVSQRRAFLLSLLTIFAVLLGIRVLGLIVWEYQNYFPPNFRSDFLFGRKEYFFGLYGTCFFIHIIASPVALVLGFLLMISPRIQSLQKRHRLLGKIQFVLVLLFVVPSGLVMATRAMSGLFAGVAFIVLGLATAGTMLAAVNAARQKRFTRHQEWATRCFVLLCSPLLLRLMNGAGSIWLIESELVYQTTAWLSWLIPLAAYEVVYRNRNQLMIPFSLNQFRETEGVTP